MKENEWRINNKDSQLLTDELQVAESFNEFFVEKVELLKQGIDKTLVEDPFTYYYFDLRKLDFLSGEEISECSRFVNKLNLTF